MSTTVIDVEAVRARFSSLRGGFAFFDAPGGSQVPDEVGEAIARALAEASGNLGAAEGESEMRPAEFVRRAEEQVAAERRHVDRLVGGVVDGVDPGEDARVPC